MSWFAMRVDRAISTAIVVCTGLIVSGCSVINYFPTFDEARAQTHAEMRKIVARIPSEAFRGLVDILPNSSFACDKKTAQYTGYWEAYVADTFDISAWLDTLRSQLLSEGYRDEGHRPGQSVDLQTPRNNLLVTADKDHDDSGRAWIEIRGFSPFPPGPPPHPARESPADYPQPAPVYRRVASCTSPTSSSIISSRNNTPVTHPSPAKTRAK